MNSRPFFVACTVCTFLFVSPGLAQRITGNIVGTVTDPSGAVIPDVRVTATDEATHVSREATSDRDGAFRIIELPPGNYTVTAEAPGFKRFRLEHVEVRLSEATNLVIKLEVGEVRQVVEVSSAAEAVRVDTTSTQVGGIVTSKQIEHLPIIGRNAMDLAQVEPGVQIRDGNDIDPTKNNFTVVALQGRAGRETQIQWDGLTVEDQSVGASVVNLSLESIQEFQVGEADLDPSQSVASGGAVNIISRRGGNQFHGSGFGLFRDTKLGARVGPVRAPYTRQQFGGSVGGALVKDKLFFFTDFERNQTNDNVVGNPPTFPQFQKFFAKPFRDAFSMGRLDWTISPRLNAFGRFSYSWNGGVVGSPILGGSFLNGFRNRTQANVLAAGLTYATGNWTHEFRFGHIGFQENLGDAPGFPDPKDSLGRPFLLLIDGGSTLAIGPNFLTNQLEDQRTLQFKYDAAVIHNRHTFRFGTDFTKWLTLGDFPLLKNGPQLSTSSALSTSTDPTDYPLLNVLMGNAAGFLTEKPVLNLPHGGTFQTRPAVYFNDTWQGPRHLTVNTGLRYFWMSDIVDPDLKRDPLLDQLIPGLSRSTHTDKKLFGPLLGLAWDPIGDGKTVIRSSAGYYYEEVTVDYNGIDRVPFFSPAIGLNFQFVAGGLPLIDPRTGKPFPAGDPLASSFGFPNGTSGAVLAPLFGQPIKNVATQVNNLSLLYQAATAQAGQGGATGPDSLQVFRQISEVQNFTLSFTPQAKTPRTFQFNAGIERQLRPGLVFTGEYVKVRGIDYGVIVDYNRQGEANPASFDRSLALAAIAASNAGFGCPADAAPSSIDCAITAGAHMSSYGNSGLGAGPASAGFAFRGRNAGFGIMDFLVPGPPTEYDGMNLRLAGQFGAVPWKPFTWMRSNTASITYTLSRKTGSVRPAASAAIAVADQSNFPLAWDNVNYHKFKGPFSADRTNMLNFNIITELKRGFRVSQIGHWFTALPQNILIPIAFGGCDGGPSEIFCSDFTGDGTTQDLLPTASRPGAFGRDVKGGGGLNKVISAYNSQFAGQATPAGQLLISQGLFTLTQLQKLGGVMPQIPLAPPGEVGLDPLFTLDWRVSWHHKFGERVEIEPILDIFNLFNRSNFDPPGNLLAGDLTGTIGHVNGTLKNQRTNLRGRGSGSFEQGANRQIQLGIRITF